MTAASPTAPARWPLTYVCAWCAATVATFPNVRAHEPATMSVCDKRSCRGQASAAYKASA